MRVTIRPCAAHGVITAPPSKSMAHRLLICAGLCVGESIVRNLSYSKDIKATIACLRALGAEIRLDGNTAYIRGTDVTKPTGKTAILPCHESGSTLRFFIPLCMLNGDEHVLTGSAYLMTRPLSVYEQIAAEQNIRFEKHADRVIVEGKLKSDVFTHIPGNVSSQFISGLLFALPLLRGESALSVMTPVESMPYIEMTCQTLREFGISVEQFFDHENSRFIWRVPGGEAYTPADVTVEGDYSNAAFLEALNLAGSQVTVAGLNEDSAQGDMIYKFLYKKIKEAGNMGSSEPIDIADCPDLGPVLFAVAALCGGGRFIGTRRLKLKESDRAAAMREELSQLGITVEVGENTVIVHPGTLHAPTQPLSGHNDHRIVMALSVLLTKVGGSIEGAETVAKSYPDFFERLSDLGVDLSYGMD